MMSWLGGGSSTFSSETNMAFLKGGQTCSSVRSSISQSLYRVLQKCTNPGGGSRKQDLERGNLMGNRAGTRPAAHLLYPLFFSLSHCLIQTLRISPLFTFSDHSLHFPLPSCGAGTSLQGHTDHIQSAVCEDWTLLFQDSLRLDVVWFVVVFLPAGQTLCCSPLSDVLYLTH